MKFRIIKYVILFFTLIFIGFIFANPKYSLLSFVLLLIGGIIFFIKETHFLDLESLGNFIVTNDFETSVKMVSTFFDSAKISIRIVCGNFNSRLYMHPCVVNSLKDALKRNVRIIILHENPSLDKSSNEIIDYLITNNVEISQVQHETKIHFMVIDNSHVRKEINEVTSEALYRFRSAYVASRVNNYFYYLKGEKVIG